MFVRQRFVYELVKDLNGFRYFVLAGVGIDLDILDQCQSSSLKFLVCLPVATDAFTACTLSQSSCEMIGS